MNIIFEEGHVVGQEMLTKMTEAANICIMLENESMSKAGVEPLDLDRIEVSVTFVSKEEIRQLNKEYRDTDKVTDVLSFPQFDHLEDLPEVGEIALGDVVICEERAREQAQEFGHSFDREAVYLFVHSILHLLGYDHMDDQEKAEMRGREEEIMARMGLTREE